MRRRVVCDASVIVALLTDRGQDGHWAREALAGVLMIAPELVSYESGNVLRRLSAAGLVSPSESREAHADLLRLPIQRWPYAVVADRAWELRENLTIYDGVYVALAEVTQSPLVTLDHRIARAPGIRCEIETPPG